MLRNRTDITRLQPAAWALLVTACLGESVDAQVLPPSLLACTHLTDDTERLRCFDREIQASPHAAAGTSRSPSAPPPGVAAPVTAALQATTEPAATFGHPASAPAEPRRLEAHISSVSQSGPRPRFVLDNGQVWQQAEIDDSFQAKAGDPVVLTKGLLGSYFMSAGSHAAVRVARVK